MMPEELADAAITRIVMNITESRELSGFAWAGIRVEIINAINQAIAEQKENDAKICENGRFLHDDAPAARFAKACAKAIREQP